jgi:hypothetical protein
MSTRRDFITLLGGAASWPLAARAQQAGKLPTVGFLGTDAAAWRPWTDAFVERLRELGWHSSITNRKCFFSNCGTGASMLCAGGSRYDAGQIFLCLWYTA